MLSSRPATTDLESASALAAVIRSVKPVRVMAKSSLPTYLATAVKSPRTSYPSLRTLRANTRRLGAPSPETPPGYSAAELKNPLRMPSSRSAEGARTPGAAEVATRAFAAAVIGESRGGGGARRGGGSAVGTAAFWAASLRRSTLMSCQKGGPFVVCNYLINCTLHCVRWHSNRAELGEAEIQL
jgi:hypothetical protein